MAGKTNDTPQTPDFSDLSLDELLVDTEPQAPEQPTVDPEPDEAQDPVANGNESTSEDTTTTEEETTIEETTDDTATGDESEESTQTATGDGTGSEDETPLFDVLKDRLGYEIDGEFEDSEDGLIEFTKVAGEKIAETILDKTFSLHPTLKEYHDYLAAGGDPDTYERTRFPEVDYNKLEIAEDDLATQERILRENLKMRNFDDEDIKDTIEEFKNSGILHSQAEKALKGLAKHQSAQQAQLLEQQKQTQTVAKLEAEKFWNGVRETVKSTDNFGGVPITEADKDDFVDYISRPVNEQGRTARDLALMDMSLDESLMLDALIYNIKKKGMKLDALIDTRATTKSTQSLRSRLRSGTDKLSTTNKPGSGKPASVDDIDLSAIPGL